MKQPCPDVPDLEFEAAKLVAAYNHHKHRSTCWKDGRKRCCLALPQPQAQQTFFTEICADEKGEPILKHQQTESGAEKTSEPPVGRDNVFSVKDERIIVSRLVRPDTFEEMQADANLNTSALLRNNASMQVSITGIQAKAAAFCIAQCMSKQPCPLQNVIPLTSQAEDQFRNMDPQLQMETLQPRKPKTYCKNS